MAASYEEGRPILIDEGLVRKLITMLVQGKTTPENSDLLDAMRACLLAYPWERNAIFVDAPVSTGIFRQERRGHVIQRAGRRQPAQQTAAEQVLQLCLETGWKTLCVDNGTDREIA